MKVYTLCLKPRIKRFKKSAKWEVLLDEEKFQMYCYRKIFKKSFKAKLGTLQNIK